MSTVSIHRTIELILRTPIEVEFPSGRVAQVNFVSLSTSTTSTHVFAHGAAIRRDGTVGIKRASWCYAATDALPDALRQLIADHAPGWLLTHWGTR